MKKFLGFFHNNSSRFNPKLKKYTSLERDLKGLFNDIRFALTIYF